MKLPDAAKWGAASAALMIVVLCGWWLWARGAEAGRTGAMSIDPPTSPPAVPTVPPPIAAISPRPFTEPESAPVSRPMSLPTSAPTKLVVRGVIRSPRVRIGGTDDQPIFGVREEACRIVALAVSDAHRMTSFRLVAEVRPSREGAFVLQLPKGLHQIGIAHDPGSTEIQNLREFWYAFVDLVDGPVDLGDNSFSSIVTRGRVVGPSGLGVETSVAFDDAYPAPTRSRVSSPGFSCEIPTDDRGYFSFTFAKHPRRVEGILPPDAAVAAMYGDGSIQCSTATVRPVHLGTFINVELPERTPTPDDSVALRLKIRAQPGTKAWLLHEKLPLPVTIVVRPELPDGWHTTTISLPAGACRIELQDGQRRWAGEQFTAGARDVIEIDPKWEEGRTVEGVATGPVQRIIESDFGVGVMQEVDANGAFELKGLPPQGALKIKIGDHVTTIPDGPARVVRIN